MKVFYFTSTGNCLEVAKAIGGELISIPQVLKNNLTDFKEDAIGIVFPLYSLGTPGIVREFMEKTRLEADYFFAVITYGNFEGGGVDDFNRLARSRGIKLSYLNSIVMVDNYLNFFKMEKQIESLPDKKVPENVMIIASDIKERKSFIKKAGMPMKMLSYVAQLIYRFQPGTVDNRFSVEDSCNQCKVCEKVCPVDNIEVQQKPVFKHKCISCYACTHNCPQNAIRLKGERSRTRFRNPGIELAEIIKANG
ncbi:MAG: EFR1 family ferrodoxin [Candidatus Rifleibacteriota bacterium]